MIGEAATIAMPAAAVAKSLIFIGVLRLSARVQHGAEAGVPVVVQGSPKSAKAT
jgi:hypothetical protein